MTTIARTTDNYIETYLSRLADALAAVAPPERDEIVREIRAHIQDSVSSAPDPDAAADRVLRLLGSPEELAERYTTESLLTRAGHSFSPWLLLRTSWRWAKLGIMGTTTFLVALFGYTIALGLTVAVFLKPFMPSKIGLWVGSEGLNVGVPSHPEVMHELLGQWFVPVIAVAAFATAVGTTHVLRWVIRSRSPRSAYQVSQTSRSKPAEV
jgi:uncharacterized membrane protein